MGYDELVVSETVIREQPMHRSGLLADGRHFYFHYNYRFASLRVGENEYDVANDNGITVEIETELKAWMRDDEYQSTMETLMDLHNQKYRDTIVHGGSSTEAGATAC